MPSINQVEVFGVTYDIEGSGGGDGIFKVVPGSDLLGLTPTPFTEIIEAVRAGKHLVMDFSVNEGSIYNITGGVSEFSYDEESQKGAITCYMLMEMPDYCLEPMRYVFSCSYDASASPTDTWTTSQPMAIYSPTMFEENPEDTVPTVAKIHGNEYAIAFKLPTLAIIKSTSTTPYDDFTRITSSGSIPVFNVLGKPYFYMGISSVESHHGFVFGCFCQDTDGTMYLLKKVLQSDNTWYTSATKFPIGGGGGADNTFVVTPGGIAGITDTPTSFLDIKAAFQANKVIQAHGIVNGQGVYGYLQTLIFDEATNTGSVVFAFSNSNPNYMNGVDFIITCHYDASASPTDTWQQDAQMPIPAPTVSNANKVLKVNGSGSAVGWDKVKSSELNNDGDGTQGSKLVESKAVTSIVKVSAMPENPDPNTLYLVVEGA